MLSRKFRDSRCKTIHVEGDADVLIVKTAIACAAEGPTMFFCFFKGNQSQAVGLWGSPFG